MCGIVGYVGKEDAVPLLVKGLKALEYRGYDSSGIAVHTGAALSVVKRAGKLYDLQKALAQSRISGQCGIGHTRWATHGLATDLNAHPFLSACGKFAVVHNGIISNYCELASFLRAQGACFSSDTDSEAVAHLIDCYYTGDVLAAITRAVNVLRGSFALGVISIYEPNVIYGVRKDSPLLVGKGKDCFTLCSDISGIPSACNEYCPLQNGEIVRLTQTAASLFGFDGAPRPLSFLSREQEDFPDSEEGDDFMLAEIREIPLSLLLGQEHFPREEIRVLLADKGDDILLLGCGSAYHAALVFKGALRDLCGAEARVEIASEFLTERVTVTQNTLVIAVSQSGETADTLLAVDRAKRAGATVLAVCNVRASSLVRLADFSVVTKCGRERAVAATKSYCAQVHALTMICLEYADIKGKIDEEKLCEYRQTLLELPDLAAQVVAEESYLSRIATVLKDALGVFFLGRGLDYAAAREGSLKLKEVSYLFSEAYPSGELKHGTLALMEKGVYGVVIATDPALVGKNAATIAEITCRGASAIVLAPECMAMELRADYVVTLPLVPPLFSPILSAVAMQQLAYFTAKERGCDVDRPRNLAKSVTVE